MRFILDENMSPRLVDALAALDDIHAIDHVRRRFGAGGSDISWITQCGLEGDWVAVTNDHHLRTRVHELKAWRDAGLIGFIMPKWFNQAGRWEQAAFLIRWWPQIVIDAGQARRGDMFFVPHKATPSATKAS